MTDSLGCSIVFLYESAGLSVERANRLALSMASEMQLDYLADTVLYFKTLEESLERYELVETRELLNPFYIARGDIVTRLLVASFSESYS